MRGKGAVQVVVEFDGEGRVTYCHVLQPQDGDWVAYRKNGTTLRRLKKGVKMRRNDSIVVRRRSPR